MRTIWWILIGLSFLTATVPGALATRGDIDLDVDARADLTVAARAAAKGEGRLSYAWEWGDGDVSAGAKVRHAYRAPGVYRVVVTVTDESGRWWERARDVEVRAEGSAMDVEVDGARARAEADVSARARVTWDWGDGEASYGRRASHRYHEQGAYVVTMKVEERDGECWTQKRTAVIEGERARDDEDERGWRASARAPGVSASVSLGWDGKHEERREVRAYARSDSSVWLSSQERHDAPGVGAPLLAVVGAVAAVGRRLMTK